MTTRRRPDGHPAPCCPAPSMDLFKPLIALAMAVELLADGLVKLFPILASPTLSR